MKEIKIVIKKSEVNHVEWAIKQLRNPYVKQIKRQYLKAIPEDYIIVKIFLDEHDLKDLFYLGVAFAEYKCLPY